MPRGLLIESVFKILHFLSLSSPPSPGLRWRTCDALRWGRRGFPPFEHTPRDKLRAEEGRLRQASRQSSRRCDLVYILLRDMARASPMRQLAEIASKKMVFLT